MQMHPHPKPDVERLHRHWLVGAATNSLWLTGPTLHNALRAIFRLFWRAHPHSQSPRLPESDVVGDLADGRQWASGHPRPASYPSQGDWNSVDMHHGTSDANSAAFVCTLRAQESVRKENNLHDAYDLPFYCKDSLRREKK